MIKQTITVDGFWLLVFSLSTNNKQLTTKKGKEVCLNRTTGLPSGFRKLATRKSSEQRVSSSEDFLSTRYYLLTTKFMEEKICVK